MRNELYRGRNAEVGGQRQRDAVELEAEGGGRGGAGVANEPLVPAKAAVCPLVAGQRASRRRRR